MGGVTRRLASKAFQWVLARKQTRHRDVLQWLDGAGLGAMAPSRRELSRLEHVVEEGNKAFNGYKY